ncbi:nucleotide-binding universal stress UspA family protein [Rhodobacter aestuarii]|uniref:Nucleotide-binding universal stress protein, UspA family n=1 Tax=Rhodobacter aestuarii TaxID=453582 RepID=A0A1N7IW37_9RHOB|nr:MULTISPECIES: universal stress protein [Rhodobacter]PTV97471.1 nucleotide-binding universal stress UspA family protein [Rhodobacter aestuarii]SIS41289.1 Nucleotide-binding universal stress protein, UspA family [Rhodobacter aestuarii]SOC05713.1 nucleotide-binding universal stress UspA family protein [Rhodobacter sp. JA431]
MTDTIIAFVDGSIYSHSLCEYAAWIAKRTGTAIDLVHVLGPREASAPSDYSGSIKLGARTALMEELASLDEQRAKLVAHRGRAILDDATTVIREAGVEAVTPHLRHGEIAETVGEQDLAATMVLIGKRGETAEKPDRALGQNLERIVRASHRPVFVAARAFKPVERVLVAWDGGPSAMRAVDFMARSPLFAGLSVRLVTIGNNTPEARRSLDDAAALLGAASIKATAEVIPGQPAAVLGRIEEEEGFDLLVMGAYGHSRIRTMIVGSTTSEMIRTCHSPVLLVR